MKCAGEQAVEAITETSNDKYDQGPEVVPVDQVNHDKWDEDHPQKRELVGSGKNLRELQAGFSE